MFLFAERVVGGGAVRVGQCWRVTEANTLIGRDAAARVTLPHPRVSRRHARIVLDLDGALIEDLSRHGTWLNQERVEGRVALVDGDFVQIGGILLRVVLTLAETLSAPEVIALPGEPSESVSAGRPILEYEPANQSVLLLGETVPLTPMAVTALAVLLEAPGRWVPFETFIERLWPGSQTGTPGYVSKYLSYVRRTLAGLLERDSAALARVRELVVRHADAFSEPFAPPEAGEPSPRELLREWIKVRRRVGFRLLAAPGDVRVTEDADRA